MLCQLKLFGDMSDKTSYCTGISTDSVTRVAIIGDSYLSRVTLRKILTPMESRFSQNDLTRFTINNARHESEGFLQISEPLMSKSSSFAHKNDHFLLQ